MSTKKQKLVIVGNSVALRVRPPKDGLNYGLLLEKSLNCNSAMQWTVCNQSFGRAISNEILSNIDLYIRSFPQYYLLNIGAVDAPSREIPLWYSDLIYGKRKILFGKLLIHFYGLIIKPNRSFFTRLRGKRAWVNKRTFRKNLTRIIDKLQKDTTATIILLGINKGNQRVERNLPGTCQNYDSYNRILKDLCSSKKIRFIDVDDLNAEEHFPDGVHYNAIGHQIISDRIRKIILEKTDE